MTAAKAMEYRIIRQLLNRGDRPGGQPEPERAGLLLERISAVLAATAGIFLLGAYLQELLWVAMAAAAVVALAGPE